MSQNQVNPIPECRKGVIPHLIIDGAAKAVEFYKKAFDAQEVEVIPAPDGKRVMHAELKIGGSVIYLNDDFPEYNEGKSCHPIALGASTVTLHRYVENIDAVMDHAIAAGATVKMPAMDMFWGDRYGILTDPFGHNWSLATHIADPTPEEMQAAAAAMFSGGDKCGCGSDDCKVNK